MQNDYIKKLRKIFKQSKAIVPTYYSTLYSLLRICCNNIPTQQITPDILNQLSEIYKYCKDMLESKFSSSSSIPQQEDQDEQCKTKDNENIPNCFMNAVHKHLYELVEPFLKFLPKNSTSTLIANHFIDVQFHKIVQKQRMKAQQLSRNLTTQNGNSTPVALPNTAYKTNSSFSNTTATGNKLHINGNNQLGVVFWINNFKMDYAVHFDIFWISFQNYLHNILNTTNINNQNKNIYSYFQNFIPKQHNQSVKNTIRQIIDPDNKYYVTSANCSDLFTQLCQPELLNNLAELTTTKTIRNLEFQSHRSLNLKYNWKQKIQASSTNGNVFINNFSNCLKNNEAKAEKIGPIRKQNDETLELAQNKIISINGNSVNVGNKILHTKYPPTIRFGFLDDNQICIKEKYISRRQFMILEEVQNDCYVRGSSSSDVKMQNFCQSFEFSSAGLKKNQTKETSSKFYLVCLSPSNYTTLTYQRRIKATDGLIFKFSNLFIQIVRIISVYSGMLPKKNSFLQKKQSEKNTQLDQSQQSFNLLTNPNLKSQQDQQFNDQTLEYLPGQNANIAVEKKLQYIFLTGEKKNKKFIVEPDKPTIKIMNNLVETQFQFQVEGDVFYIPKNIQILAKNANQVIFGHMSDKIQLQKGMKIILEEIQFHIS